MRYGICNADRDCEPFAGAGKISREWLAPDRSGSKSKDQDDRPKKGSSPTAGELPRSKEATGKALPAEERERWKREETEFIKEHDRDESNVWFIVDVRWLEAWKAFVKFDKDFPGPIDNHRLVDRNTGQPKPGFVIKEHYRGVNSAVWSYWHKRYGGGPAIQRPKLDLYDVPPEELDKTVTVSRPAARPAAADLEKTVVVQRPARSAPQRDEPRADAPPARSTPPAGERSPAQRAASVRPARSSGGREEPQAEERHGGRGRAGPLQSEQRRGRAAGRQGGAARRGESVPAAGRQGARTSKAPTCAKCDGPHETERCPHFSRPRERHKDAWSMLGKTGKAGGSEEDVPVVKHGRVVPQPGDGSCLFHSLSYGLSGRSQGQALRREICNFIARNPDLEIGDNALKDWINYDTGGNVQSYARDMSGSSWGGGIEMAAFSQMKGVNVHVYEKCSGGFRRISAFESPGARKTVSVLYQGRAHYEALAL